MSEPAGTEKVVITTCHGHCSSVCVLKIHVRDGVITRIESDDGQEPQYRACVKGRAYRQLTYAADRILFPLRRIGERGAGEFERISWDEALETVTRQIKRVAETHGPGSNILLCSGGDLGWLHNGGLIERVLVRTGGYSGVLGNVSAEGAWFAAMATYGCSYQKTLSGRDSLLKSHLVILWGWNPVVARGPRQYYAVLE